VERKQETAQIQKVIDLIAERAIELPPDARPAFIKREITGIRGDFQRTYEADPRLAVSAITLVDGMYGQIKMRVRGLEKDR
jgi:hypothetical protein